MAGNCEPLRPHLENADFRATWIDGCRRDLRSARGAGRRQELGIYRYTWIRDASFTLYALMRLGYTGEADAFMKWIEARCSELKPGTPLQVMYRMDGGHDLEESQLSHFEGYLQIAPGPDRKCASNQLQLDIYGELMDSVYIYNNSETQSLTISGCI